MICPGKKLSDILTLLCVGLFIYSCSSKPNKLKTVKALPLENTLHAATVSVKPKIKFINVRNVFNVNDEYLVFLDRINKNIFKVFSLPELKFLYAWGRMGRGPHELSLVDFRQVRTYNGHLVFFKPAIAQLEFYLVTDTSLVLTTKRDIGFRMRRNPINNVHLLSDSLYIITFMPGDLGVNDPDKAYIMLESGNPKPLFTFGNYPETDLTDLNKVDAYSSAIALSPNQSRMVIFYRRENKFKIFDNKGNMLKLVKVNDPYLSGQNEPGFIYRGGAMATDKKIYTIAANNTEQEIDKNIREHKLTFSIEVWNWNGDPLGRFKLKPSGYVVVSEKYHKLYGISYYSDDVIYVYNL